MIHEEVGEDLLTLSLSIGGAGGSGAGGHHFEFTKKRRRSFDEEALLLQARDRMIRAGSTRPGLQSDSGLQLVRLLFITATAVEQNSGGSAAACDSLRQLYRLVSLSGDPIQRVAAYFADALATKLLLLSSPCFHSSIRAAPSPADEFAAFAALYCASPFFQFAHFTANQAIMEAFEEEESFNGGSLHVVDFDLTYGSQWPSLIQSLADKATSNKPITLRITGFGRSSGELLETEKRLSSFAGGFGNLSFEFDGKIISENWAESIRIKKNSTLAVNLVFYLQTLNNYSAIRSNLMRIHSLNPTVVTLVEKEGNRGSRFLDSLHYFAAMFDSLDDCFPAQSKQRLMIEKNHLGWEIMNAVNGGDEGNKGLRYESLETWKGAMEKNGFEGLRLSSRSVSQARLLLKIKSQHCSAMDERRSGLGFRVTERDEGKALSLGWQQQHLITATAWRRRSWWMID
ncbi:DELLA protein RGL2 [Apostasia shenzhenica]|uniref:DELLA protein RGL2 n=1 Tax=Apostasia shenzhenica TaxID=1088818 RepID=A0A2I0B3Z0_9ASPA|nr:DELLA protein RGL2 [Apostasia shenzhenica]